MGNRRAAPEGFGWGWRAPDTERARLARLQREEGFALSAARTAVDNCEWRFNKAKEALVQFDKHQPDKCNCNTCPTCGKEKA